MRVAHHHLLLLSPLLIRGCEGQGRSGGGGSRSSYSSNSRNRRSRPSCLAANCATCEWGTMTSCSVCKTGFALDPYYKKCVACPPHCDLCFITSLSVCAKCSSGYMENADAASPASPASPVAAEACTACSEGCRACHDPSPSGCDECSTWIGWRMASGPGEEGCAFSWWNFVLQYWPLATILALFWAFTSYRHGPLNSRRRRHLAFVQGNGAVNSPAGLLTGLASPLLLLGGGASNNRNDNRITDRVGNGTDDDESAVALLDRRRDSPFPSGIWRGYYTQHGTRHDRCELDLHFIDSGIMSGGGVDDVGRYSIEGRWGCSTEAGECRVAFTKQYHRRTANVDSSLRNQDLNQGHSVEYTGRLLDGGGAAGSAGSAGGGRGGGDGPANGRGASFRASFGGSFGLRGDWRFPDGAEAGTWHLWPCAEGWRGDDPEGNRDDEEDDNFGGGEAGMGGGGGGRGQAAAAAADRDGGGAGFEAAASSECCVCFDRSINCRVDPCGHIAFCGQCCDNIVATATRSGRTATCPLCRTNIQRVTPIMAR